MNNTRDKDIKNVGLKPNQQAAFVVVWIKNRLVGKLYNEQ